MELQNSKYHLLIDNVGKLLAESKLKLATQINTALVTTYWNIGKHIVEFEQGGSGKAVYGNEVLIQLSKDLSIAYGKGFSRSNLTYMRRFYLTFPNFPTLSGTSSICETVSHILSWSHYFEILKATSDLEINFYINQCSHENWSVRELKRQMKSMLFHRLALSKDKKGIIELSKKGVQTQKPEDIIKDPYVLEFLNIPQKEKYLEGELEDKIIGNMQDFLLELGKGKELSNIL